MALLSAYITRGYGQHLSTGADVEERVNRPRVQNGMGRSASIP
jgi:hypothetical protein